MRALLLVSAVLLSGCSASGSAMDPDTVASTYDLVRYLSAHGFAVLDRGASFGTDAISNVETWDDAERQEGDLIVFEFHTTERRAGAEARVLAVRPQARAFVHGPMIVTYSGRDPFVLDLLAVALWDDSVFPEARPAARVAPPRVPRIQPRTAGVQHTQPPRPPGPSVTITFWTVSERSP